MSFAEGCDSSSEDSQAFREAPAQQVRSSQLNLISYSRGGGSSGLGRGGRRAQNKDTGVSSAVLSHHPATAIGVKDEPTNSKGTEDTGCGVGSLGAVSASARSRRGDTKGGGVGKSHVRGQLERGSIPRVDPKRARGASGSRRRISHHQGANLERKVRGYEPQKPKGGGKNDRRGEKGQGKKGQGPDLGKGKTNKEKEPKT